MNDLTASLSPLSPDSTAELGQPQTWTVERSGSRDVQVSAWKLSESSIDTGSVDSSLQRTTTVTIWLTTKGRLLTIRRTSTANSVEQVSEFHETPASAYRWLVADGKGKLGRASKAAWIQACRAFKPMAGLEVEQDAVQKYAALTETLKKQFSDEVTITFENLEDQDRVGVVLPESARRYRQWWGNEETAEGRQCRAWLDAGWEVVNVDLSAESVTFRRRS